MYTNLSKNEIENLLTIEVAPCSRKIGEFRLEPFKSPINGNYLWRVHPNFSDVYFFFVSLTLAMEFAKSYKNHHTNDFWIKLWNKSRIYSLEYASKCSTSISFAL